MARRIWIDMDGTIANLYGVQNWLPMLQAHDPTPYRVAAPLVDTQELTELLRLMQSCGFEIGILSALPKNSSPAYDAEVIQAKRDWLNYNFPSFHFTEIKFVPFDFVKNGANRGDDILVDDEDRHLSTWEGLAIDASQILHLASFLRRY